MDQRSSRPTCLTVVYAHPDGGWAYSCACGYESAPIFLHELAQAFAQSHESLALLWEGGVYGGRVLRPSD